MAELVFWIDVDNTLLNNDHVKEVENSLLEAEVGQEQAQRFWELYEQVRKELGVIDIPLTLQRFREQTPLSVVDEVTYRHIHSAFDNFPFYQVLYPNALETLHYLRTIGLPVIVSDGDLSYQAEKILNSALAEAVEGRVLLFIHKQEHLQEIMQKYPAEHYAMIDDKPSILIDIKNFLGEKVTTVFVKQGKYATKAPEDFQADIAVEHFGDLCNYHAEQFLEARKG